MIIKHAKLYTMGPQGIVKDGYLQIVNGRIAAVGTGEPAMPDEQVLDAKGASVTPGFIDAHTHLGMWEDGLGFEGDDGNEDTDPATPHMRGLDAINPYDRYFAEALDAGVTAVVSGPGSANPISGQMLLMHTCGNSMDEMVIKEPLAIKFALGENPKSVYNGKNQAPQTRMATAAIIREQLYKAQQYRQMKLDAQNDDEIDEPDYDPKCEALLPLLEQKIPAHIHCHRLDDIGTAIRLAKEFSLKLVLIHCTEGYLRPQLVQASGASAVLGPLLTDRSKPELKNASPASAGVLAQNGVLCAICTDHPCVPIEHLPLSALYAHKNGLEYYEALKAITINPAKICGVGDTLGSLEEGKLADILLFEGEPLTAFLKPTAVWMAGERVK